MTIADKMTINARQSPNRIQTRHQCEEDDDDEDGGILGL